MTITSKGYGVSPRIKLDEEEQKLFIDNLDLLLKNQKNILRCGDYFFCTMSFAYGSWPYLGGDGPIPLGYLLLGWSNNTLTEKCPDCSEGALLTAIGGSPLSGTNFWNGICRNCGEKKRGESKGSVFITRASFVSQLRKIAPAEIKEWQEHDGVEFSFEGDGLKPAKKKRQVTKKLAVPVTLAELIDELKNNKIRITNPLKVSEFDRSIELKFQ